MSGRIPPSANIVIPRAAVVLDRVVNARRPTPRRSGAQRLWVAFAIALAVLVRVLSAAAQESRVLLVYPEVPSPLLREALVHVRGEFGSVGLSVKVITTRPDGQDLKPQLEEGEYGALVFEERPGVLIMRAYHPGSPRPITQRLFTRDGRITAHVAAVRAVETLRAALQEYYYSTNRHMPDPVKKIARIDERGTRASPPAPPPRQPMPPRQAPPPPPPPAPAPGVEVALWMGPTLMLDVQNRVPAGGVSAAVSVGRSWYFASVHFESTLLPFHIDAPSGQADMQRLGGALEFWGRFKLSSDAALFARLGGGLARYSVSGRAEPGFTAKDPRHSSPFFAGGVGSEYWLGPQVALFLCAQASYALDAPYLRFAGLPTERFERPFVGLMFGVAARAGN